jgi:hypothetical protein
MPFASEPMRFGKKKDVPMVETWIIGSVLKRRSAQLTKLPKISGRVVLRVLTALGATTEAARMVMTPAFALAV